MARPPVLPGASETQSTLGQELKARAAKATARWARARETSERGAVPEGSRRRPAAEAGDGKWPISERARWLPALAIAIGIIYGADETHAGPSSGQSPAAK